MQSTSKTPVNIVTGFLGVGKTTALRRLLADRPAGEYWAVLVNEFGEVGIDGAALADTQAGLNVVEVPGGCICCTTSPQLRVSLTRLLRERRPDRLLIEPSGLGHPAGIVDLLRDPFLSVALDLRSIICLVDPRHLEDARYTRHETWRDQIVLADVLVANKCDRADAEHIDQFEAMAARLFPPKQVVATTIQAKLDPAWLDLVTDYPATTAPSAAPQHHLTSAKRSAMSQPATEGRRHLNQGLGQASCGWVWSPERVFSGDRLAELMLKLTNNPSSLGLQELSRVK